MTVLLVISFMGIMMILLGAITSYAFQQAKYGRALYAREQALSIAEAGLEYYRWFLAKNPSIMTAGAGLESPYTYTVSDPEGGTHGTATITATANLACGVVQSIDIQSRGVSSASSIFPRTLAVRYMKPSVAQYAFLYNAAVWFGSTNTGVGPYHSNNGLRMDGTNNSVVSSSLGTNAFWCTSSYGCSPSQWKNGVFGNGSGNALWQFPVSTIDFAGIASNFSTLRGYAQSSGLLLSATSVRLANVQQGSTFSSVGGTDQKGFHLVFNSNGTVSVYRVTATLSGVYSYNSIDDWHDDYTVISSETLHGTYTLPSGCALVYSDARTWITGTVSGKITVIAADTGSYVPDIILPGNIAYASSNGSTGLTAVAEGSVNLALSSPDSMSIAGIFVAQTGQYGRDYYLEDDVPSAYANYVAQSTLTVNGTIVSAQHGGVCWSSGGTCVSGYQTRTNTYDRILAFSPPPFTPSVSAAYKYVLWREQ